MRRFRLLNWFAAEQVGEESTVQQEVDDLERFGEGDTVLILNRELPHRHTTAGA